MDDLGRLYAPVFFGDTVQEANEVLAEPCGVPLDDWRSLAAAFAEDLGEDEVRRTR